jgi:hypothetical protein
MDKGFVALVKLTRLNVRIEMSAQLTVYAYDCPLPAIRPDSYVERFVGGGWCLRTPSCWDGDTNWPIKLEDGDIPDELIADLVRVGGVDTIPSDRYPGTARKYFIQGQIIDPEWWRHRAEDGMLGSLNLDEWLS